MNKLTKICATALFAFFLTACDNTDDTKGMTKVASFTAEEVAQGKVDYQKLLDWNLSQEAIANLANQNLQEKLATQDLKQIQGAVAQFNRTVEGIVQSLNDVEVSNPLALSFKEKTKALLLLSNQNIIASINMMFNPTDEAKAALEEKAQEYNKLAAELQQLQVILQQAFTH